MHYIHHLRVTYMLELLPGMVWDWLSHGPDRPAPRLAWTHSRGAIKVSVRFLTPLPIPPPAPWSPSHLITPSHSSHFLSVCSVLLPAGHVLFLFLLFWSLWVKACSAFLPKLGGELSGTVPISLESTRYQTWRFLHSASNTGPLHPQRGRQGTT